MPPYRKIMLCVTEDWFALSHFKPLMAELVMLASEVVVITNSSGRFAGIEALGCRVIPFDYHRASLNPRREMATMLGLARIFRVERPDVVHALATKTVVLVGLARLLAPVPRLCIHLTGLGHLAFAQGLKVRVARQLAITVMANALQQPKSWLFVENDDDLAWARNAGIEFAQRYAVLGGAGVAPSDFPELAAPRNVRPIAAFVGRMIRSKGVEVLMRAALQLAARSVPLHVDLYGASDLGNPEALDEAELLAWNSPSTQWHGPTTDIQRVWRQSDIFVLPALTREGMPRAMLEAAAYSRPLIVSNVPGCRHFVRDGVEGLIVPPGDAEALAAALAKLATDPDLRQRMGRAARARVLAGYTEAHVRSAIRHAYLELAH